MTDEPPGPSVVGHDERADGPDQTEGSGPAEPGPEPDLVALCAVARRTLIEEGIDHGSLDLLLVDRRAMRDLNREHMGADRPTDVLAFPLDGPDAAGRPDGTMPERTVGDGPPVHLGDVVICPAVAAGQAAGHCGSFEAEMTLLVIHGVLHVLGHDHAEADERQLMQARERHHLARHGHRHPVPA